MDDRNRAAGQALGLYFRAAELEAQIGLLQLSRNDLTGAITKSDELGKKGFRLPTEPGALRRQLLDTEADLIRARAGLAEVNSRLKGLLGVCDLAPDEWLWPAIEVQIAFEPVDAEAAVAVAMAKRPELLLLRTLACEQDAKTVPVVREYLHAVSGLIGAAGASTKPLVATLAALKAFASGDGEKDLRNRQVSDLLADRERAVAEEVRRVVADLNAKTRLVTLSRERVVSADEHRRDAEQKAERASGSFVEVLTARLEWYKARGQLTTDVMAWHTARAKAREAQGVFVWECCGNQ
jgi:outer membrane protein TolC